MQAAALEASLFTNDDATVNDLGQENKLLLDSIYGFREDKTSQSKEGNFGLVADGEENEELPIPSEPQPAWEDPDEDQVQVNIVQCARLRKLRESEAEETLTGLEYERRLRQQHRKLNSRTAKWASPSTQLRGTADGGSLDSLITRAGGLLSSSSLLPPGQLEATRLKDANHEEPAKSVIRSVEFHPRGQLLMAAGLDRRLRFFNIDGVENPRVQSVMLEDMPVHQAAFTGGGAQVIASGRRSFFYCLDLETAKIERVNGIFGREERSFEAFAASSASPVVAFFGRDGNIPLVSTSSRQSVGSLKMNGSVRAGAFSADGNDLLTSGSDGVIYLWDMRMQRCRQRYVDEGSTRGSALSVSPDGQTFASGSESGVVNVYQHSTATAQTNGSAGGASDNPEAPLALRPLRSLPHLTTNADSIAFNGDGQLLAIASRMKRDALRLVHLPSLTVFSNWPTSRTPLHYVHSVCFSPGGGYLAIGNAKGRVVLYRLHHFRQA